MNLDPVEGSVEVEGTATRWSQWASNNFPSYSRTALADMACYIIEIKGRRLSERDRVMLVGVVGEEDVFVRGSRYTNGVQKQKEGRRNVQRRRRGKREKKR